jgi:hypothetical protein
LTSNRPEGDGAGDEKAGGPPPGASAGDSSRFECEHERRAGEFETDQDMERSEVPTPGDGERRGVEQGRQRRLPVDGIPVQHTPVSDNVAHSRDRGLVRIEELMTEAWQVGQESGADQQHDERDRTERAPT